MRGRPRRRLFSFIIVPIGDVLADCIAGLALLFGLDVVVKGGMREFRERLESHLLALTILHWTLASKESLFAV